MAINVDAPQLLGIYIASPGLSWTITVTVGGQEVTDGCQASWSLNNGSVSLGQATGISCTGIFSEGLLLPGAYQITVTVRLSSGSQAQAIKVIEVG